MSGPRLLRFGVLLCGDPAQAEDLTQEALARVYVRWARLRADNPEAYARRTMINLQAWVTTKDGREYGIPLPPGGTVDASF